ncbi:DUF4214 domain-containing protein [Azospirillum sp. ST 5-10]|uniref:DUF4214 domain-containing protein n=1 Tax=unclassified Azospirillum TaxID=2630922 RepID=UPI003F49C329
MDDGLAAVTEDLLEMADRTVRTVAAAHGLDLSAGRRPDTVDLGAVRHHGDADFVCWAHRELLGRAPDVDVFRDAVRALKGGRASRHDVVRALARRAGLTDIHVIPEDEGPATAADGDAEREVYALADFEADSVEAFVDGAYRKILKRAPDPSGFENYRAQLAGATLTRQQMIDALLNSDEHRSSGRAIVVLGRDAPDAVLKAVLERVSVLAREVERLEYELARIRFFGPDQRR